MNGCQFMVSAVGIVATALRQFEGVLIAPIAGLEKYTRFGYSLKERRP